MTDENLSVDGLSTDGSAGDSQEVPSEHLSTPAVADQEKLLSQNDVNNMIGAAKRKAYEKGLETARTRSQQETQSQHQAGLNESTVRELVNSQMAEVSKQQQAAVEDQRNKDYAQKVYRSIDANVDENLSADEITAFRSAINRVNNFERFPAVLDAVHTLDNSAEVLRHLASDEGIDKLAGMSLLSYDAVSESLLKISNALKRNKNAKTSSYAPNPISQIDTNVRDGMGGTEPESVADYRQWHRTRGR